MYLRFTVGERDPDSRTWKGVFIAACELKDRCQPCSAAHAGLREVLDWFNANTRDLLVQAHGGRAVNQNVEAKSPCGIQLQGRILNQEAK